jgi:methylamine dehydrogenase accessory protein MauD
MLTVLIVSQVLLWILLGGLALALLAIARQIGVLHERLAPIGALAPRTGPKAADASPRLTLATLAGGEIEIGGALPAGQNRLLLFVSSRCPICKKLIPIVKHLARSEGVEVVFAGDSDLDEQRALVRQMAIEDYPFVNSEQLGLAFQVDKLPHAVLLSDAGRILARGLVNSREHLESLIVARDMGVASVQEFLSRRSAGAV